MTQPAAQTIERERHAYTVAEVAVELGVPAAWLDRWLGAHPRDNRDRPLYRVACRKKLLTPTHIALLIEALPCPSSSTPRAKKAKAGASAAPTLECTSTEALAHIDEMLHAKSSRRSSKGSKVVDFPSAANRRSRARRVRT
jgi:hypothetical protein